MKIAVVGCGAVGSFYGAKLCRDGHDVHFLLRSDYDIVRRKGVIVRSKQGDFQVQPRCAAEPQEIGLSDLVLVALKTTANSELARLLPPLTGKRTAVITLQNGLGSEGEVSTVVTPEQVLGGLAFVCLNRVAPGIIQHIDHGTVVLGEYAREAYSRTREIAFIFNHARIKCEITNNLAHARWEKLVWNVPFNGLGVASAAGLEATFTGRIETNERQACLTTDKLLADPHWTRLARDLMAEIIAIARALGHRIEDSVAEEQIERTLTMGAYKPSTVIDFERGQPLEVKSMFGEPLRQAREAGVWTPRLEALCGVLTALDRKPEKAGG
jgi:2-dehydropantoate 2-reductase